MNNEGRLWKVAHCGFKKGAEIMKPVTMTIQKACEYSGLSKSTIYNLINADKLVRVKVGKRSLITTASIEALLNMSKTAVA